MSCKSCDELGNSNNKNIMLNYNHMTDTTGTTTNPTFFSYFSEKNLEKEFTVEVPEMILVFVTSAGISYYAGDSPTVAGERGAILAVSQYIGGAVSQALQNAGDFKSKSSSTSTSKSPSDLTQYGPVLSKFLVASGLFVGINKAALGSQQPIQNLFGESAIASVVAHYGGPYVKKLFNGSSNSKKNLTEAGLPTY
jgi:hypothetical protein